MTIEAASQVKPLSEVVKPEELAPLYRDSVSPYFSSASLRTMVMFVQPELGAKRASRSDEFSNSM